MASAAISTFGAKLYRETAIGSGAYSAIAEIVEVAPFNISREALETTNHDTSDNYREFIKGLCDLGEISFVANWLISNATHNSSTGLLSDLAEPDLYRWRVEVESGAYVQAYGFLTAVSSSAPTSAVRQFEGTLKFSGPPTFVNI